MARKLPQILTDLRLKIETLASQRDAALQQCESLSHEVDLLNQQLESCRMQLNRSRLEVDALCIADHTDDPEKLISARRRLSRLIAKIDRCVALLKEDADIS